MTRAIRTHIVPVGWDNFSAVAHQRASAIALPERAGCRYHDRDLLVLQLQTLRRVSTTAYQVARAIERVERQDSAPYVLLWLRELPLLELRA